MIRRPGVNLQFVSHRRTGPVPFHSFDQADAELVGVDPERKQVIKVCLLLIAEILTLKPSVLLIPGISNILQNLDSDLSQISQNILFLINCNYQIHSDPHMLLPVCRPSFAPASWFHSPGAQRTSRKAHGSFYFFQGPHKSLNNFRGSRPH